MWLDLKKTDKRKLRKVLCNHFGLNDTTITFLFRELRCHKDIKVCELPTKSISKIVNICRNNLILEDKLLKRIYDSKKHLKNVNNYRNIRHALGLPANGQNTHNNAKTNKRKKN